MVNLFRSDRSSLDPRRVAANLRRLGWIGFWLQVILGFIPILVLVLRVLLGTGQAGTSFGLFLAIACLLALLLAIYWCYHYVRLGHKLENPGARPTKKQIIRALWTGLIINMVGMTCAVLIAMGKIGTLTLNLLRLPQGATVITTGAGADLLNRGWLISPSDMIIMQAVMNVIAAALIGMIITLLLLRRMMQYLFNVTEKDSDQ